MGYGTLVLGVSGSGKSWSTKNLDPDSTFFIKTVDKPLPYRGGGSLYKYNKEKVSEGNMYITNNANSMASILKKISNGMPHVKVVVIDDFQFSMSEQYFSLTKNLKMNEIFEVYREIARRNYNLFGCINELRDDLNVYILCHSYPDDSGFNKMKIVGKLTEKEYAPEGVVTVVLHSVIVDGIYMFLTKLNNNYLAKSPGDLFDEYIDNDLKLVDDAIREYF